MEKDHDYLVDIDELEKEAGICYAQNKEVTQEWHDKVYNLIVNHFWDLKTKQTLEVNGRIIGYTQANLQDGLLLLAKEKRIVLPLIAHAKKIIDENISENKKVLGMIGSIICSRTLPQENKEAIESCLKIIELLNHGENSEYYVLKELFRFHVRIAILKSIDKGTPNFYLLKELAKLKNPDDIDIFQKLLDNTHWDPEYQWADGEPTEEKQIKNFCRKHIEKLLA